MIIRRKWCTLVVCASILMGPGAGSAAVFGSLGNFDTVNDTGRPATVSRSTSRIPCSITLRSPASSAMTGSSPSSRRTPARWSASASRPSPTCRLRRANRLRREDRQQHLYASQQPGCTVRHDRRELLARRNAGWTSNPCDHFGVSTYGNPAAIKYSWLVDDGAGNPAKQAVGVPAVSFVPINPPPAGGPPAAVQAVIQAPVIEPLNPYANAFWVKLTQTTLGENVDLGDLLIGDHPGAHAEIAALNEKPESETEWYELQIGRVDELSKEIQAERRSVSHHRLEVLQVPRPVRARAPQRDCASRRF